MAAASWCFVSVESFRSTPVYNGPLKRLNLCLSGRLPWGFLGSKPHYYEVDNIIIIITRLIISGVQ